MKIQKTLKLLIITGFLFQNFCKAAKTMNENDFEKSKKTLLKKINAAIDVLDKQIEKLKNVSPNTGEDRYTLISNTRIANNLASQRLLPDAVVKALQTGSVPDNVRKSYSKIK